eukprot:scaffold1722_cov380-Prasinococcus_capsulatus_cf.AAC.8
MGLAVAAGDGAGLGPRIRGRPAVAHELSADVPPPARWPGAGQHAMRLEELVEGAREHPCLPT